MVRTAPCHGAYEGSIPFGTAKPTANEKVRLVRNYGANLISGRYKFRYASVRIW